jgi:dsRNA-specific ribonuclease
MSRAVVTAASLVGLFAAACAATGAPRPAPGPGPAASGEVRFDRDIRSILSENCFKCHGPDPANRQGGLRLDRKEDLFKRRAPGAPVVPGKPYASRLWARISVADAAQRMPPPQSGKSLTDRQKELLRRWIAEGARWSEHWAFQPVRRPAVPRVNGASVRNPIDAFILAKLREKGLNPSPEADPITLIRRVTLDLTGLPPTPEEVDAFLQECREETLGVRRWALGSNARSLKSTSESTGSVPRPNAQGPTPGTLRRSADPPVSEKAYERLVARLLQSPAYGERWARHWLDAARYADSDGFEKDKPRFVWFYRDWVINALNRDLPYDQFVIEQIAGDLLPNATQDQVVATGFLRNSMINEEGGVDPEQFRMEAMFDRMDALGKSVLGLTIQCAQCHSHKYDPLTHEEYYKLFAFINNCDEANAAVYNPADQMKRAEILRRIQEMDAERQHSSPDWKQKLAAWEERVRGDQPEWRVVRPELDASGGQKHTLLPDGSILAGGYAPTKHTTDFSVKVGPEPIAAVRLELLNDPNLPQGGPGRSIYGLCALTEFRVDAAPADQPGAAKPVKIASGTADVNPPEQELAATFDDKTKRRRVTGPIGYAIDGKDETAWGLDIGPGRSNVPRKAVFVFEKPVAFPAGTMLTFRLVQNHGGNNSNDNQNNNLGRFRFSVTGASAPTADPLPQSAREILAIPSDRRSPAQVQALFGYWRAANPEFGEASAQIEQLWRGHPQPATQLVLQEREQDARPTHLLERGNFLKPANAVDPGVPAFLHPLPEGAPRNRLTFARWLVDPRSPTTARSIVNRVWQQYFGTGLVRTSEDLGLQSEAPSHPELLDFLASVFTASRERVGERVSGSKGEPLARTVSHSPTRLPSRSPSNEVAVDDWACGWSLKRLHKLIVMSATYRQRSVTSSPSTPPRIGGPGGLDRQSAIHNPQSIDPENRLLWRGPRLRVEAEVVRDIALAASGLLNPKIGGPSVYPPAPEFIFQPPSSYGAKQWPVSTGPDRYRRALYTFSYRSVPFPTLQAFDAPNGDQSCVRRSRSNTPLQALITLNEPLFVECARALALKTLREAGASDEARVTYAFRRCLARSPTPPETAELLALLRKQQGRFATDNPSTWALATGDPKARPEVPPGVTTSDLAAWTVVARVLLNLDETITKE